MEDDKMASETTLKVQVSPRAASEILKLVEQSLAVSAAVKVTACRT